MSSREGGQGRGGAGHTARSLLPTPVNSRPGVGKLFYPTQHTTNMSSREGELGREGAGHTARSLLPSPVNTRPPRLYAAEPLPRRINTTIHQNTTEHPKNHSPNNHNTRPTYNHTKNTTFRIQLRKINPDITTDKRKIFETTFKDLDVPLTKLSENNSGYYAITDEAAAVDKLTSFKATELFTK
ncbi:hypothetical protein FHG87_022611 [Trinorchestia longiramus]|nr:hypothetical protein FHG87_022611 [Trinorchestia longiramus]